MVVYSSCTAVMLQLDLIYARVSSNTYCFTLYWLAVSLSSSFWHFIQLMQRKPAGRLVHCYPRDGEKHANPNRVGGPHCSNAVSSTRWVRACRKLVKANILSFHTTHFIYNPKCFLIVFFFGTLSKRHRYPGISFVPKNLFEQFQRAANLWV